MTGLGFGAFTFCVPRPLGSIYSQLGLLRFQSPTCAPSVSPWLTESGLNFNNVQGIYAPVMTDVNFCIFGFFRD